MKPTDITVQILTEIRDSIREISVRVDQTNARLDQTNAQLDQTRTEFAEKIDALTDRITQSEVRTATAIMGLAGTLESVKTLLEDRLNLRGRLEHCEGEIQRIKKRVGMR